jgi:hypothetical protein
MAPSVGIGRGMLCLCFLISLSPGNGFADAESWRVHLRRLGGDNNLCMDGSVGSVSVENGRLSLYDQGMDAQFPFFTVGLEKDGSVDRKRTPLTQYPNARVIVSMPAGTRPRDIRIASPKTACIYLVSPR